MKNYFLRGCIVGLLWVVITPLFAQPNPDGSKRVEVEIQALSIGRGIADLGVMQNGKKTPFYVPSFSLSNPIHYQGAPDLQFIQTQVVGESSQEVTVASATVPLQEKKVWILFTASVLPPGKYSTHVIPCAAVDSLAASARVYNLSNRVISLELNGIAYRVKSGGALGVPLRKSKVNLFIPRVHKITDDEADICRETYTAPEGGRLTLLLMNESGAQTAESESLVVIPLAENSQLATPPNTAVKESMP